MIFFSRHCAVALSALLGTLSLKCDSADTIKLYAFDCGKMRLDSISHFNIADDELDIRELAVPCYVIVHPNGTLLWNGGLQSIRAQYDGWQDLGNRYFERLDQSLSDQLPGIGLTMASFDFVAFSHMHSDHVGVANEISGATLLIQEAEYDTAFADKVELRFFDPSLYDQLVMLDRVLLHGEYDVFGDGTVQIISAPGHTPGHQMLYVELANEGPIILSGDLYHFQFSRVYRRVPNFNWNADITLESFEKVESLLSKSKATLWIEHDLAGFESRKTAPEYYD